MGRLLDLLFPPRCAFCQKKSGSSICDACQAALPWVAEPHPDCHAPLYYTGDVRKMLHRYKFQGRASYAAVLGDLMRMCLRDAGADRADLVSWIPSSRRRQRGRGYDQSRKLAEALARGLGLPLKRLLVKTTHNVSQSTLRDAAARRDNVCGAFRAICPLEGRSVILVDDIFTTGATMGECSRVLAQAGAGRVIPVCAAVAGSFRQGPR